MTTQGKHTPGPWKLAAGRERLIALEGLGLFGNLVPTEVIIAGNSDLAFVPMYAGAESVANARLIAAAPELLEALRSIIDTGLDAAYIDRAAAIARARGVVDGAA